MTVPLERSQPPPLDWSGFRILVAVGVSCALIVVTAFELTAPIIATNQGRALQAAFATVLPGSQSQRAFVLSEAGRFEPWQGTGMREGIIFVGYDGAGELVGFAIPAVGMGYQDRIRLLYGYHPERQAIVGLQVLESRETPGLGARIRTDPEFLANFDALAVTLNASGEGLAHPIELNPPRQERRPWQIDAITGATVSSRAVAEILRQSTARWVPLVNRQRKEFEHGEPTR